MYIYIYSHRQTKRALRLTKHHLFIVVAFAAEAMMDDDAVRGKIFCTYFVCHHCKTKRVKKFKKSNPTFYPSTQKGSVLKSSLSTRGWIPPSTKRSKAVPKLCRSCACEDKNDSSLGVVFMQSRSFWTDSSPIVVHENADDDFGDENNIFIQSAEQPEKVFVFLSS